jgi:hypothetical protein
MLLVIIAIGTATILTTAYLSSRDNSSDIGDNTANAATARWAAESGVEIGMAAMQTPTNWRVAHTGGLFMDDYVIGEATIDLFVTDAGTGQAPDADSRFFELVCEATVDGIVQRATARVVAPPPPDTAGADVDLSEFALFSAGPIDLVNEATITRWTRSPLARQGRRIALGTHGTTAGTLQIDLDSAALDGELFLGPGASPLVVQNASEQKVVEVDLLDAIPMPEPPSAGVAAPASPSGYAQLRLNNGQVVLSADSRHSDLALNNGDVVLQGSQTIVSDGDVTMANGSTIVVDGDVTLVVFGDLDMSGSAIHLADGATLTLHLDGALRMQDSLIGEQRAAGPDAHTPGEEPWIDPQRVVVYGTSANDDGWLIDAGSAAKATIYTPHDSLTIQNQAALYGRVAAAAITVANQAGVFYDPGLDTLNGYTNLDSALYESDGHIGADYLALPSLDPGDLIFLANATGVDVWSGNVVYETTNLFGDPERDTTQLLDIRDGTSITAGTAPARTEMVDFSLTSFGSDFSAWE